MLPLHIFFLIKHIINKWYNKKTRCQQEGKLKSQKNAFGKYELLMYGQTVVFQHLNPFLYLVNNPPWECYGKKITSSEAIKIIRCLLFQPLWNHGMDHDLAVGQQWDICPNTSNQGQWLREQGPFLVILVAATSCQASSSSSARQQHLWPAVAMQALCPVLSPSSSNG